MFKEHPRGLPVLFFTELWERFGFYLMLGIFLLYMTDSDQGGMAMDNATASDIYGTYLALVYLTPFLGGILADRILGMRKSIFIGGILMGLGYLGLGATSNALFWPSLFLIIFGNGFFKPNISTLVGNLYSEEKYKKLKDSGFNIFYMGINIGAFVCNFVAAYLRNEFGWGYAFSAAGIGMFIGVIWFFFGQKHVKSADILKPTKPGDMSLGKIFGVVFLPAIIAAGIGWFLPVLVFGSTLLGSNSTDAFLFASIPILIFYLSLLLKADAEDKAPIAALLSIFGVVIIFWAIFHQNGAALTVWARDYTDREMPAFVQDAAESLSLTEEVYTENILIKDTVENRTNYVPVPLIVESDAPKIIEYKLTTGSVETVTIDTSGKVIEKGVPHPYYAQIKEANWPESGKGMKLLSTEIFQSVNPGFVVVLTPLVVGFFGFLRRRNKEPSTPAKIGYGLLITAASTTLMMLAVITSDNGSEKSSALWLISTYGVITVGELFLSPMGLSLVSKLSPTRITSLMMGGWFLSTALGNKLSGVLSGLWETYDNKAIFFLVNFIGAFAAAVLIFLMVKWLRRVVKEHTGSH